MTTDYKYAAFISYKHLSQDASAARRTQYLIETRSRTFLLADRKSLFTGIPKNPCFPSEYEYSGSYPLPENIADALAQASTLVVICSPDAKEDARILREIETYIELHDSARIIAFVSAGDPEDCIPDILLSKISATEGKAMQVDQPEVIVVDGRDGLFNRDCEEKTKLTGFALGYSVEESLSKVRMRKRIEIALNAIAVVVLIALILALLLYRSTS